MTFTSAALLVLLAIVVCVRLARVTAAALDLDYPDTLVWLGLAEWPASPRSDRVVADAALTTEPAAPFA